MNESLKNDLLRALQILTLCLFIYFRQGLNDAKRQNHTLMERLQALQAEHEDNEVRRNELEGQIRQSHNVSQTVTM